MTARLAAWLVSRTFISLLTAAAICLLVWYTGPWIGFGPEPSWRPLATKANRLVVMVAVAAVWLLFVLVTAFAARRRNRRLVEHIAPDPGTLGDAAEAAEMVARFEDALEAQKRQRYRGGRLFVQMPWYVLLGASGAGKTTAITNSGLEFVGERREVRGAGGTRRCDWFFTRDAIFLDIAGRFTTQDSIERGHDAAGWQAFLSQLKRHRPTQPINGALIMVPALELLGDRDGLDAVVRMIRERLMELANELRVRVPVYLFVTKADVVPGFGTYFDDLDADRREQVFGFTFTGDAAAAPLDALTDEFNVLLDRLVQRRASRLHAERDAQRRAALFGFPQHFSELRHGLERFGHLVFGHDATPDAVWRGVYFTSGTQDGSVVDRLLARLADRFGLAMPARQPLSGRPRPYFLTTALHTVLPGEAGLVGRDGDIVARRRRQALWSWALSGLAVALIIAVWWWSYASNATRYADLGRQLVAVDQALPELLDGPIAAQRHELSAVLPALDRLRQLPAGHADNAGEALHRRFGLSQFGPTRRYAEEAYHRALTWAFLPRLIHGAERRLARGIHDAPFVFAGLKAYLLVGQRRRLLTAEPAARDRYVDEITGWFDGRLWAERYSLDERQRLRGHLEALLAMPLAVDADVVQLDADLVERGRATLTRLELHEQAYDRLKQGEVAAFPPPWRFGDALGPGQTLFRRLSGESLDAPVRGLFTRHAFHEVVQPGLEIAIDEISRDAWVLGYENGISGSLRAEVLDRALDLYYFDFIKVWTEQLNDIVLRQPESPADMAVILQQLTAEGRSPLARWLAAVRHQTLLTRPLEPAANAEVAGADVDGGLTRAGAKAVSRVPGGRLATKGARFVAGPHGAVGAPANAPLRGVQVERHFAYLDDLVFGVGGAPPQLEAALRELGEVQSTLMQSGEPPSTARLQEVARRLPAPLDKQFLGLADLISGTGLDQIRDAMRHAYQAGLRDYCLSAIAGRFPFVTSSSDDVRIDDFAALFAPGGRIDSFFAEHLDAFVDTTARDWRWRDVDGRPMQLDATALRFFQRARKIRDGLFALGSRPSANFRLHVRDLSPQTIRVRLDLDGQELLQDTGPFVARQMQWPGPTGQGLVRISFTGLDGTPTTLRYEGLWAWFHLLNDAEFQKAGSVDRFDVTIGKGSHWVRLQLLAGSVVNPFDLRLFRGLTCPREL